MHIFSLTAAIGLIALFFGLFSRFVVSAENGSFAYVTILGLVNIGVGIILLAFSLGVYFYQQGLAGLKSPAAKRKAGFGLTVGFYSLAFFALLISLNYAVYRRDFFRFDSTEQQVYTLAPQTLELLKRVGKPVIVRGFFVGNVIDDKIRDLLNQLSQESPFLSWSLIDPEKSPSALAKYGISKPGSLHFAFADDGDKRSAKVEGDISEELIANALLRLIRDKPRNIYVLQGNGEGSIAQAERGGFAEFRRTLESEYMKVQPLVLGPTGSVPSDAEALIILGPMRPLLVGVLERLSSYLEQGGRMLVLVEPKFKTNISLWLRRYGIEVGQNVVVDFMSQQQGSPVLGIQPVVSDFGDHLITKNFTESVVFSSVSSVRALTAPESGVVDLVAVTEASNEDEALKTLISQRQSGLSYTELALTSSEGWAENNLEMLFSENPQAQKEEGDIAGPVPVALVASKQLPNSDQAGSAQEQTKSDNVSNQPVQKQRELRMVVVGDIDFASNAGIRDLYNRDFLLNSVNWLVGDDQEITIRARTMRESRKFITEKQFAQIFIVAGVLIPELLMLIGASLWWLRRKGEK